MKNKAIICDLDGTLSLFDRNKKSPYIRDFENDICNEHVKLLIYAAYNSGKYIIFLSGRNDKFREQTEIFLNRNLPDISYSLFMRKDKDNRKDTILKEEMYNNFVKDDYEVEFIIDDRLQVCRLWYSLGLFVFNVNQGLEEF